MANHQLADAKCCRVADGGRRKRRRIYLEHGKIRVRIVADDVGHALFAIGRRHGDLASTFDNVAVGEDESVSRRRTPSRSRLVHCSRRRSREPRGCFCAHADVDDRRTDKVHGRFITARE